MEDKELEDCVKLVIIIIAMIAAFGCVGMREFGPATVLTILSMITVKI